MPYNASNSWIDGYGRSHGPQWYSYDHGPVHFLTYSTEFDFAPGSVQYQYVTQWACLSAAGAAFQAAWQVST